MRVAGNPRAPSRSRPASAFAIAIVGLCVCTGGSACHKVSHKKIDEWERTENGPNELEQALRNTNNAADLRGHAAEALISIGKPEVVRKFLSSDAASDRQAVVAAAVPRLWKDARIAGRMDVPTARQSDAKDALFDLRSFADKNTRAVIDQHLIDWLAGGYYEGRAQAGRVSGHVIVRAAGPAAAPKLLAAARMIIAAPPDKQGRRAKIGSHLLRGLAYCGSPKAVGFILDLVAAAGRQGDATLPGRAMEALREAYVAPVGTRPADPAALGPNVSRLAQLADDESQPGRIVNDAADLIEAAGMPHCLHPLVAMISARGRSVAYRWMGAQKAIRCGGAKAIAPVLDALPKNGSYQRGILKKYVWDEIVNAAPKAAVEQRAKALLGSGNWVARISAVELLGMAAVKPHARADAAAVRKLAGDKTALHGWWGKGVHKPVPTLGQRATEVARKLEEVAN